MFEAIDFRDFDVQDTPRYLEYVSQCIQIPCMLSPFLHLAFKDEFHTKLGYEAGLCWLKGVYYDEKGWLVPAGEWTAIDWADVFRKHVPAGTTFFFVPSYAVDLWRRQLGDSILVEAPLLKTGIMFCIWRGWKILQANDFRVSEESAEPSRKNMTTLQRT